MSPTWKSACRSNLHVKHVGQDTGQTALYQKGVAAQHRAAHYVDPAVTGLSGSSRHVQVRDIPLDVTTFIPYTLDRLLYKLP